MTRDPSLLPPPLPSSHLLFLLLLSISLFLNSVSYTSLCFLASISIPLLCSCVSSSLFMHRTALNSAHTALHCLTLSVSTPHHFFLSLCVYIYNYVYTFILSLSLPLSLSLSLSFFLPPFITFSFFAQLFPLLSSLRSEVPPSDPYEQQS